MCKPSTKYRVIRDLQGGTFGMGRDYTAREWLEQAIEWRDSDGWEDDMRDEFIKHWEQVLAAGNEQDLIDYISDIWDLEFEKMQPIEVEGGGEITKIKVKRD